MAGKQQVDRLAALEAATERAREATREANEATAGLRTATREAAELLDRLLPARVSAVVDERTAILLDEMADRIGAAQREAVRQVVGEFDALMARLLGTDEGQEPLEDSARRYLARTQDMGPGVVTLPLKGPDGAAL